MTNYNKIELVSYSETDFDKLNELVDKSIPKEKDEPEENNKSTGTFFLVFLLLIMIAALVGVTFLYFFPEQFTTELDQLECTINKHNDEIDLDYTSTQTIKFDKEGKVITIDVADLYTFDSMNTYLDFKNNEKHMQYFNIEGTYKYIDSELQFKLMYKTESIIQEHEQIKRYLTNDGYSCIEGKYYE